MHEAAVVTGLLSLLDGAARDAGIARITEVRLRLGRMRGLDARQIRAAFEVFAEGGPAEGARMVIEEISPSAHCRGCGHDFVVEGWSHLCPNCGGDDLETSGGRELDVTGFDGVREAAGPTPDTA